MRNIVFGIVTLAIALFFTGCVSTSENPKTSSKQSSSSEIISSDEAIGEVSSETPISSTVIVSSEKIVSSTVSSTKETTSTNETVSSKVSSKADVSSKPKQQDQTEKQVDYSDWIPCGIGSLETMVDLISKGYVVYHNGQYLASPEYFQMIQNQEIVYFNDVASEETEDRFGFADAIIEETDPE